MNATTGMLTGRTALVIGMDDIGAGIADRLEREGASVVRLDTGLQQDISKSIADALQACGQARLDVLVCNLLPPADPRTLEVLDATTFELSFARVTVTLAAMRTAIPALKASGRGRIVLIGHRYGESVSEGLGAYNAAAWALVGLARTAAVEWGQFQVTTNVLLPLARTSEFDAARSRRPAIIDLLVSQLPLRRAGDSVEDIGGAAAFLASDAACFVNGQVVCADGGQQVAGPVLNPLRFA